MAKRKETTEKDLLLSAIKAQRQRLIIAPEPTEEEEEEPIPEGLAAKVKSTRKGKR